MNRTLVAVIICISSISCKNGPDRRPQDAASVEISNIDVAPPVTEADQKWGGVYAPLDGRWRGKFRIYVDTRGQQAGERPRELDPTTWQQPPYELSQTIDVQQRYESESPYFQRVWITDTYADGRVEVSRGVNKVQDGQMWCVVRKPDDLVVHEGTTDGPATIIWSRDRESPKAIEWFHETVEQNSYTIVGWGYYGSDDPELQPRMYFHGVYERVEH